MEESKSSGKRVSHTALLETSSKRACVSRSETDLIRSHFITTDDFEWKLTCVDPITFRNMIRIMCGILLQCKFYIERSDEFSGVVIGSLNPTKVCMLHTTFECTVDVSAGTPVDRLSFCLDLEMFYNILGELSAKHILEIVQRKNSDSITVLMYQEDNPMDRSKTELQNLMCDEERYSMKEAKSLIGIDLPVSALKNICKQGVNKKFNSRYIQFHVQVLRSEYEHNASTEGSDALVYTKLFLAIRIVGERMDYSRMFTSLVNQEGNNSEQISVRVYPNTTSAPEEDLVDLYKESYPTKYLNAFLRHMEREEIHIALTLGGEPIILKYSFGTDKSTMYAFLAPAAGGEDDLPDDDE